MKKIILLIVLFTGFSVNAQKLDNKTKNIITAKYLGAKDDFDNQRYNKAIEKISEIEALTGKPTLATALNLKIKSLVKLRSYKKASKNLEELYNLDLSTEIIKDISTYENIIKDGIKEEEKRIKGIEEEKKRKRIEEENKNEAKKEAIKNYIEFTETFTNERIIKELIQKKVKTKYKEYKTKTVILKEDVIQVRKVRFPGLHDKHSFSILCSIILKGIYYDNDGAYWKDHPNPYYNLNIILLPKKTNNQWDFEVLEVSIKKSSKNPSSKFSKNEIRNALKTLRYLQ